MKALEFTTAFVNANSAVLNNANALVQTHALRMLIAACEDRITELSDEAIGQATEILTKQGKSQGSFEVETDVLDGIPRRQVLKFQLQVTEKYDLSKSNKYTEEDCQNWRGLKREQENLKRMSSAITKQLTGIVEGYVARHPGTTPDEIKAVIKAIKETEN